MKPFHSLAAKEQQSLEDAAGWLLCLEQDPSQKSSVEFQTWIRDPGNERVFVAVQQGLLAVGTHSAAPEILARRAKVMRQIQAPGLMRKLSRKVLFRAAALILIGIMGGGSLYMYLTAPETYGTGVGMRRIVMLADGSRISLDSDTDVRVSYTDRVRKITLDRGRARFDVAHDATRPFTVTAGSETVVAIGTSFNVEKIGSKILVTLIQGRVMIKEAAGPKISARHSSPVALKAGQEFEIARNESPIVKPANLKAAIAWEAGQLVFKNVSLEEAVARENRYTTKPVSVDASVALIRISGVFNAGDVSSFVSAVTNYFPVQATTGSDDQILLQAKP